MGWGILTAAHSLQSLWCSMCPILMVFFSKDLSSKAVIYFILRECCLWFIMSRVKGVHRNSENLRSAMWGEGSLEGWQGGEREEIGIAM